MLKKRVLAGVLALGVLIPTTVSAGYVSYVGYSLPPLKKNNYTSYHDKVTNDDYIHNIVENISGDADTVTFWAEYDDDRYSNKYDQKIGNATTIELDGNLDVGNEVRLAMENADWKLTDYGFVAGRVDFR
jgi:hypothetical protein